MDLSKIECRASLAAKAAYTRGGLSGDKTIGVWVTTRDVAGLGGTELYSVRMKFWATGADAALDVSAGVVTTTTAEVRGTRQIETATMVGTITTAGNMTLTLTAAGMTGSPKAISKAVSVGDTASVVATKARAALQADADVAAMFEIGGTGADVVLTRLEGGNEERFANDATVNLAYTNGTCAGLTPDATSTDTAAGVASSGTAILDGANGEDFEGVTIAADVVHALLIERIETTPTSAAVEVDDASDSYISLDLKGGAAMALVTGDDLANGEDLDFLADGVAEIMVHVLATAP